MGKFIWMVATILLAIIIMILRKAMMMNFKKTVDQNTVSKSSRKKFVFDDNKLDEKLKEFDLKLDNDD